MIEMIGLTFIAKNPYQAALYAWTSVRQPSFLDSWHAALTWSCFIQ